jgi:hypothetical protein
LFIPLELESILMDALDDLEKRYEILSVAVDYCRDNNMPDLLIYSLRWMIKNKKFPSKHYSETWINKKKRMSTTEKNKVFKELLETIVKSGNIPDDITSICNRHVRNAAKEYWQNQPKPTTKDIMVLSISFDDCVGFSIYNNNLISANNWSEILTFVMGRLEPFFDMFQIGDI